MTYTIRHAAYARVAPGAINVFYDDKPVVTAVLDRTAAYLAIRAHRAGLEHAGEKLGMLNVEDTTFDDFSEYWTQTSPVSWMGVFYKNRRVVLAHVYKVEGVYEGWVDDELVTEQTSLPLAQGIGRSIALGTVS